MELYLIRHGETPNNHEKRYTGWADVPLNEQGIAQIRSLKERLKDLKPNFVYASDLKRTVQTALLLDFGTPIHYTPELRECHFGKAEGLTYAEFRQQFPGLDKQYYENWAHFAFPEGESYLGMCRRVIAFMDSHVLREKGECGVVVTHGGCICAIMSHYLTGSFRHFWRFKTGNGSPVWLTCNDDYIYLNV